MGARFPQQKWMICDAWSMVDFGYVFFCIENFISIGTKFHSVDANATIHYIRNVFNRNTFKCLNECLQCLCVHWMCMCIYSRTYRAWLYADAIITTRTHQSHANINEVTKKVRFDSRKCDLSLSLHFTVTQEPIVDVHWTICEEVRSSHHLRGPVLISFNTLDYV